MISARKSHDEKEFSAAGGAEIGQGRFSTSSPLDVSSVVYYQGDEMALKMRCYSAPGLCCNTKRKMS
jgi:hypothetical protein